ncbi:uncharacterized protein LOC131318468 isoform X2 [Rhododendron vialii]|uniref:uncharacterized protein LOC131318468 isoform X2 n=1 Tax=Rhododendron vialii TaxID=182163 RepID=UPI00265ED1E5|nr:uncharacterized protein LOC131318468 isoform X2 [Rhododendron vialii]
MAYHLEVITISPQIVKLSPHGLDGSSSTRFVFCKVELLPEDEEEEDKEEDEEDIQNLQQLNIALRCFDDACMKLNIMLDVIEKHQMLRSIAVTDIMNQGKIVVPGDRIAELRDFEKAKLLMPIME